jgi:hypothetical protein
MAKKQDKKTTKKPETYTIVSDNDGNDSFEVEAADPADAAVKALQVLGWWVAKP